jgi:hypothetical protein
VDWNVNKAISLEIPADKALVLEESEEESYHDKDDIRSTPLFNA